MSNDDLRQGLIEALRSVQHYSSLPTGLADELLQTPWGQRVQAQREALAAQGAEA